MPPVSCAAPAPIAVAMDPLDGSNNIDIAAPLGSLLSLLLPGGVTTMRRCPHFHQQPPARCVLFTARRSVC